VTDSRTFQFAAGVVFASAGAKEGPQVKRGSGWQAWQSWSPRRSGRD